MKSLFSVRHTAVMFMVLSALVWQGCKKSPAPESAGHDDSASGSAPSAKSGTSDRPAADASYCEKSFSCKLALVKGRQARDVLMTRHDTMVKHCEDIMSKMPPQLRREYEACARVQCGAELEKCVQGAAERAARALGLLKKQQKKAQKKPVAPSGMKKGAAATHDATTSGEATPAGKKVSEKDMPPQGSVPPPRLPNPQADNPPPPGKKIVPPPVRMSDVAQPTGSMNTPMAPSSPPPPSPPPGVKLPARPDFATVH